MPDPWIARWAVSQEIQVHVFDVHRGEWYRKVFPRDRVFLDHFAADFLKEEKLRIEMELEHLPQIDDVLALDRAFFGTGQGTEALDL